MELRQYQGKSEGTGLTETSELGCGDDITVVMVLFYRRVRESQEMIVDRYYIIIIN